MFSNFTNSDSIKLSELIKLDLCWYFQIYYTHQIIHKSWIYKVQDLYWWLQIYCAHQIGLILMDSNCTIHIKLGVPDELKVTTHQSQLMLVIPNYIKLTSDYLKLNLIIKLDLFWCFQILHILITSKWLSSSSWIYTDTFKFNLI